jgi:predicted lipid-binding transport protein (Tim44 family)
MNRIRRHVLAVRSFLAAAIAFSVWVALPTIAAARGGGANTSGVAITGSVGHVGLALVAILIFGGGFVVLCFVLWVLIKTFSRRSGVTTMAASGAYAQRYNPNVGLSGSGVNNTPVSGGPVVPPGLAPGSATQTAPGLHANGLDEIKAADPGFNEEQFLDRCQLAFGQVQQAWIDRNADKGRAYMSTGLYTTWSMEIQQMIASHKHEVMEDLVVQRMTIISATRDANFDTIKVQIDALRKEYAVDDNTGKVVSGDDKHGQPFIEFWTFQRSAEAKTLISGGVTAQKCPNCGAPLSINQSGSCTYCNAPVMSGKFDWVLSHIEHFK